MASPTKPARVKSWLTKQQMADVLDVTLSYFDKEVRRYAKPEHVQCNGRRLLFYGRGVMDSWYEARQQPVISSDDRLIDIDLMLLDASQLDAHI